MKDLVALANYRAKWEAEAAGGLLDDAEIAYLIQSLEGAGLVPAPHGTTIMVRPEDLERAKAVIGTVDEGPQIA